MEHTDAKILSSDMLMYRENMDAIVDDLMPDPEKMPLRLMEYCHPGIGMNLEANTDFPNQVRLVCDGCRKPVILMAVLLEEIQKEFDNHTAPLDAMYLNGFLNIRSRDTKKILAIPVRSRKTAAFYNEAVSVDKKATLETENG
jgi:hypothetical protein